jgi:hypothetical protein
MQDGVHLLVAPHRSQAEPSNLDFERENTLKGAEKGFTHSSEPIHVILVRLWSAEQFIPVQPLVDGHASVWDGIHNAVGHSTRGVVPLNFLVSQAIQEIREGQHQLLNISSVDYGGLLLSLFAWCAEGLKEGHNRLISEAEEIGVLGIKAAAHVVHASSQPFYQGIFWKP